MNEATEKLEEFFIKTVSENESKQELVQIEDN